MPNLSACAASPDANTHTPMEHATETSDAVKNKLDIDNELLFMIFSYKSYHVHQTGLEPVTDRLEGGCSIQLSYWRIPFPFQ